MDEEISKGNIELEKLSQELIVMAQKDQAMRIGSQKPGSGIKFDKEIDKVNTKRLKEIVQEVGWPTISKVGKEASYAAWLLIQHADLDPDFQEECLGIMKEAAEGDVLPANIAYLTDRVAVNRGKPQTYGTQLHRDENGKAAPRPIEDIENIESRRATMGLEPFWQYAAKYEGSFKWPEGYKNHKIGRFNKAP